MDTTIPSTCQTRYKLNLNYATFKQDINKLLAIGFIEFIEKTTWLSPVVIVLKKNGKLKICINFRKLNATTEKDPYPLPFKDEMLNTVARAYSFLDGYLGYHQISILQKTDTKLHLLWTKGLLYGK